MNVRRRFGRVRRLPSGRWQARYSAPDGSTHSAPHTFERRSEAERWLAAVEADLQRGVWIDPTAGKLTVGEWADRWLEAARAHLKVKTQATYASLIKTKIKPTFGHLALVVVKPIMVGEWLLDLKAKGFSPSRVRQSYRLLSQIMRSAVENGLIASSPCKNIRLPKMPVTEPRIITEAEADRIIAATQAPHDLLVMMLAYAGLRVGEAFALRRRSFDLIEGSVTVSETLVEIEGNLSFDVPKNHQHRTVQLSAFVVARATAVLESIDANEGTLVFTTQVGDPLHYNAWRTSYFNPAVKAARLTGVTPHDLRASHATWVAAKYGVMAAASRLGHAHASVTTRHYARSVEGLDRRVADGFDTV